MSHPTRQPHSGPSRSEILECLETHLRLDDLLRFHHELRAAFRLAGKKIFTLNFGRRTVLRRTLREARALGSATVVPARLSRIAEPFDSNECVFDLKMHGFGVATHMGDGPTQLVSHRRSAFPVEIRANSFRLTARGNDK